MLVKSLLSSLVAVVSTLAFADQRPLALIYRGPGSCPRECFDSNTQMDQCVAQGKFFEGCSEAAAIIANTAAFDVQFVGPTDELSDDVWQRAKLWIQPGGKSSMALTAMTPKLKDNIRQLVSHGGGYVGFCAGGFAAAEKFHNGKEGLGLFPGQSELYTELSDAPHLVPFQWLGATLSLYWEGGPYFKPRADATVDILAYYPNQTIAALRNFYGNGRVAITGPHPEAPVSWNQALPSDGMGIYQQANELAVGLIKWAGQASP